MPPLRHTYVLHPLDDRQIPVLPLDRLQGHAFVGGVELQVVGDPPVVLVLVFWGRGGGGGVMLVVLLVGWMGRR